MGITADFVNVIEAAEAKGGVMKGDLLKRVRLNQANMGMIGTITLPAELHHELVAEIERLQAVIKKLFDDSPPVSWNPRDAYGDYVGYPGMVDEVDPSNSGDVHAHGIEEGFWRAANRFREAAEEKGE